MAKLNVTQFAEELKLPVTLLLEQLQAAGVKKKAGEDAITEQDKTRLLDYLRKQHGGQDQKKKITLTRKQTSEIKAADSTGRARTIQVEVRKKRVFVKRDGADAVDVACDQMPAQPVGKPQRPLEIHRALSIEACRARFIFNVSVSMTSPEGLAIKPRMPESWRICCFDPRAPESAMM